MSEKTQSALRPVSIAIIDDDASVRVGLQRLCKVIGLNPVVYASGQAFIDSLAGGTPNADCLLLDVHMPAMTGLELQRHLQSMGVKIPTILFSADDVFDVPACNAPMGIVSYLRKPMSSEELLAAVHLAVDAQAQFSTIHE